MTDPMEGLEIRFDEEEATPTPETADTASVAQVEPTPAKETGAVSYGPYYSSAKSAYERAEAQYRAIVEQVKQLRSIGADIPPELEAQIAQYAAEVAILKRDVEEAKRRDALALVPGLVGRYTGGLPADLAKAVGPIFRDVLSRAVATNPEVVNDPQTLEGLANYAIGLAYRKSGKPAQSTTTTATGGLGVPVPPPREPKPEVPEMPEFAKKVGMTQEAWAKYSTLPDLGEAEIDL